MDILCKTFCIFILRILNVHNCTVKLINFLSKIFIHDIIHDKKIQSDIENYSMHCFNLLTGYVLRLI